MSNMSLKRETRKYSAEFKQEAIKLALLSEGYMAKTASDLGIPSSTLTTWIRKSRLLEGEEVNDDGEADNLNKSDLLNENKELRKRLARLEQEKAILKKAAAYFAKEME